MRKLTNEDIIKNSVDTINQYKVLQYLKKNLNIDSFDVYLFDRNTIKIIDKNNEIGYFKFNKDTKEVSFFEKEKNLDYEINL